jgi:hypothetical protein
MRLDEGRARRAGGGGVKEGSGIFGSCKTLNKAWRPNFSSPPHTFLSESFRIYFRKSIFILS